MVDTHCHLYLQEFETDVHQVIDRAKKAGVSKFFLPAIDSQSHDKMIGLEQQFPGECYAMMGLHPCSVKENYETELNAIAEWLERRKFIAIGEIGLDLYWDKTFQEQQLVVFHKQIRLALDYSLPIVIHSRNAITECIGVVRQYKLQGLKGVFHCFGGSFDEAEAIIDCGFSLGIGGVITYKNSGLANVIPRVDIRHLVLETDSPYLAPVPHRGKRNESSYLSIIAQAISGLKGMDTREVMEITDQNALQLFDL